VGTLSVTNGAQITSGSGIMERSTLRVGTGQGGRITIAAEEAVSIDGQNSGLFSETKGPGRGGDLAIEAREIRLTDRARISATSLGTGNAGNLRLTAHDILQSVLSTITSAADQASGGNIALTAGSRIQLHDSQLTTSVEGGAETVGGILTLNAPFVILDQSLISANALAGRGGRSTLMPPCFWPTLPVR
jgi:hypothetical protein